MPFAETWIYLETVIQSEVKSEKQLYNIAYMGNLEKWYGWIYLKAQLDRDLETKLIDTKGGGGWGGGWDELGHWEWHACTLDILDKTDN